ncbi:MAG: type II secretion system protein [bacterium]
MARRMTRAGRRGYTLIELAVVLAVMGIVAGLGTGLVVAGARAYRASRSRADAYAEADYALRRLTAELRGLPSAAQIESIGSDAITFRLDGGAARTFERSGSTLLRDGQPLARDVTAFELTYYGADGSVVSEPSQVCRIAAAVAVNKGGHTARLRTEIFPRAFRSSYLSWEDE